MLPYVADNLLRFLVLFKLLVQVVALTLPLHLSADGFTKLASVGSGVEKISEVRVMPRPMISGIAERIVESDVRASLAQRHGELIYDCGLKQMRGRLKY